jgi:hypothetical protein
MQHPFRAGIRTVCERSLARLYFGGISAMAEGFNLPSYLEHSRKVDLSDLDFSEASRYPVTEEEIRCLTYMMDIEGHTIVYLKNILSTCAVRDPETTAFLSCWAYEEFFQPRVGALPRSDRADD